MLAQSRDYNVLISARPRSARLLRGGAWCAALLNLGSIWGINMNLPKIDISALPDLDTLTGVFGSLATPGQAGGSDDTIIILMVFLYEFLLP